MTKEKDYFLEAGIVLILLFSLYAAFLFVLSFPEVFSNAIKEVNSFIPFLNTALILPFGDLEKTVQKPSKAGIFKTFTRE